jgi:hypothetical protein
MCADHPAHRAHDDLARWKCDLTMLRERCRPLRCTEMLYGDIARPPIGGLHCEFRETREGFTSRAQFLERLNPPMLDMQDGLDL